MRQGREKDCERAGGIEQRMQSEGCRASNVCVRIAADAIEVAPRERQRGHREAAREPQVALGDGAHLRENGTQRTGIMQCTSGVKGRATMHAARR